jgi:hypothetical protein
MYLFMIQVAEKRCKWNKNTHCVLNNFYSENRAIYEIMWKNNVETDRPQMTKWRMRFAYWITNATHTHTHTHTHTECVIVIAFPRQKCFRERASMLRYTYNACLVKINHI